MPTQPKMPRVSMAQLMQTTGYSRPVLQDLTKSGVIHRESDGKFESLDTYGAIIRKLREKDAGNEDRQRKNRAEADSAELAALEAAGKLIPLADAKLFWSESRIEIRQLIERNPKLCGAALLAKIAALKKKQPGEST